MTQCDGYLINVYKVLWIREDRIIGDTEGNDIWEVSPSPNAYYFLNHPSKIKFQVLPTPIHVQKSD